MPPPDGDDDIYMAFDLVSGFLVVEDAASQVWFPVTSIAGMELAHGPFDSRSLVIYETPFGWDEATEDTYGIGNDWWYLNTYPLWPDPDEAMRAIAFARHAPLGVSL